MRGKSKVARQVPYGGEDDAAGTGEIDTTRRFCRAIVTALYLNRRKRNKCQSAFCGDPDYMARKNCYFLQYGMWLRSKDAVIT
mmetsp:Transcript_8468/g.15373  ORF Transcript_8468/g.15373 Transcript_8468/m.15373 type:complete len:83 (+) Transcript_8468:1492-1740(+)